jgi:hypothetical protein
VKGEKATVTETISCSGQHPKLLAHKLVMVSLYIARITGALFKKHRQSLLNEYS